MAPSSLDRKSLAQRPYKEPRRTLANPKSLMWLKHVETMPLLPPMTGNSKFIPPIKVVVTGGCFMTSFDPHSTLIYIYIHIYI